MPIPRRLAVMFLCAAIVAGLAIPVSAQASQTSVSAVRCKIVTKPVHANDVTRLETVWKFSITVSYCYNGRRIIRPGVTCDVWHTDPITIVNGGCSTQDNIYAWGGSPYGGYYAQAQATFQNCIIKFACLGQVTVTLKIWATGNGAWIPGVST